jgi:tRNA nucleotidyltransferase/poly(A) polymerase
MENTAFTIVRELQEAGHEAYFAGGCVRDRLRGVIAKDYDIATSASPDEILRLYPKGDTIGAHFGVILVRRGGHQFEIATFREDGTYTDGRRPESVTFSTSEADARRRDFTINGMFYDPVGDLLIDHVSGKADLKAGLVRAIGNPLDRFEEDYLRLLRAVRFATLLNFEIEPATWEAVRSTAACITRISPERIREELDRLWLSPSRVRAFDLLVESGLMHAILPEIIALQGCEQPPQWHPEGDVFVHTRLMLSHLPDDASLPLVLSVLFHDIAKPATFSYDPVEDRIRFSGHDALGARMAEGILLRLRYSNAVINATVSAVAHHMQFKDVRKMRTSTLKRFMARDNFDDELELHRVDCAGSNGLFENYDFVLEKRQEFGAAQTTLLPPRLITGADLIALGMAAGPGFGEILTEAQDLQLEGALTDRDDALRWLDRRVADSRA